MLLLEFLSFICSVLRVSPESVLRRHDRCRMVSAEAAAETATLSHVHNRGTCKIGGVDVTKVHELTHSKRGRGDLVKISGEEALFLF